MMKNGCEDLPEFTLYQRTLVLLSKDAAAKQREKISGFLDEDYRMLHKHFSCFAYPDILGAGMLAEKPLAAVHARVSIPILTLHHGLDINHKKLLLQK